MESISKSDILFLYTFLWFSYCFGARVDEPLSSSSAVKLKCTCISDRLGNFNHSATSNCSSSCDCSPVKGSDGIGWACLCESGQSPQISSSSCFNACNCTSDSISEAKKKRVTNKLVVAILLLCVVLTTIAFLASLAWYFYRKDRHLIPSITSSSSHKNTGDFIERFSSCLFITKQGKVPGTITQFSYIELEKATNKFSSDNLIGHGGSSNVYRAQLRDGRVVAVKRLNMHEGGGSISKSGFLSEVDLISRLNHRHLVSLLGYCLEFQGKTHTKLIVFEYMGNGNLRDCLDVATTRAKHPLDWNTRVSIALGVARGMEYLHESAAPRILHRDIKSTNILLDDDFIPKITDLGMAKKLAPDGLTSCTSSPARMMGTFGYFAPEYAIVGRGSLKSDIFSFGVVILELITGRKPVHKSSKKGEESLVLWATPRLQDSKLVISDLPDPSLKGKFPQEEIQIMAHLAKECLQWDPDSRPNMSEVVQILSTISLDKAIKPRRNLAVNRMLSSAVRSLTPETHDEISVEREEIGQIEMERWKATMCSLPSTESLNWEQVYEDVPVDLTEPRFETFVHKTGFIH